MDTFLVSRRPVSMLQVASTAALPDASNYGNKFARTVDANKVYWSNGTAWVEMITAADPAAARAAIGLTTAGSSLDGGGGALIRRPFFVPYAKTLRVFGDSIMKGDIASDEAHGMAALAAASLKLTLSNLAVASYSTGDVFKAVSGITVGETNKLNVVMCGMNDITRGETVTSFKNALMANLLWLGASTNRLKLYSDSSFAFSSGWSVAGGYSPPVVNRTTTAGAYFTATIVGRIGYIIYLQCTPGYDTTGPNIVSMSVDSGEWITAPITRPTVTSVGGRFFAAHALRIPFASDGTHTVTMRVDTPSINGFFVQAAVGTGADTDALPAVVFIAPSSKQNPGANDWTYARGSIDVCDRLIEDGWNLRCVNAFNSLAVSTDFNLDGIHPNDVGHAILAEIIKTGLSPLTTR